VGRNLLEYVEKVYIIACFVVFFAYFMQIGWK